MKSIKIATSILILCIIGIYTQVFATTKGTINSETVGLRKEPSEDSTILELMSLNEEVEILSEEDNWYKVEYKKIKGYAKKEYIKALNSENSNTVENKTENNNENNNENTIKEEFKGKLSSEIKLKILPLINSSDVVTLQKNTEITVSQILNDWCNIETNIGSGWIRINILNRNIQTVKEEQELQKEENNAENNTEKEVQKEAQNKVGYVNVDTVNVRSKADSNSEILTSISKNTEVEILSQEESWYKIKTKNITGYIAAKFISDKKVAETTSRGTDTERTPIEEKSATENKKEEKISNQIKTSNSKTTDEIVAYAKQYLGCKYVSGGTSPKTGFDCSGFTYYVYKNFGKTLSRTSSGQASNGTAVEKSELQLGDILIFNDDANKSVGHVGIYIGGNAFIHAANSKKGVITTSLSSSYYSARYVRARRII